MILTLLDTGADVTIVTAEALGPNTLSPITAIIDFEYTPLLSLVAEESRLHNVEGIKIRALVRVLPRKELPNPEMPIRIILGQTVVPYDYAF